MVSAINSALGGLASAGKQLEASAQKIASANTSAPTKTGGVQKAPEDITSALIDTQIASNSFKANLEVIKADNNNFKSLIDIKV